VKKRVNMVKWWKPILLTFILGSIGGFFGYGITNRPIVDYYIDSPPSAVNFKYSNLTIRLKVRNTGNTYAIIDLIVSVQNASISNITKATVDYSENEVKFHYRLRNNMDSYTSKIVEIFLENSTDNFIVSYTVTKRFELSPTGLVNIFGELNPYHPVVLTYNRTNTDKYELMP